MNQSINGSGARDASANAAPSWILDLRKRLEGRGKRLDDEGERIVFLIPLFVDNGSLWTILGEDVVTEEGSLPRVSFPAASISLDDTEWNAAATLLDEVLGLDPTQGLQIGELDELRTLGGLKVRPLVAAVPRPEMAGRTLSANTDGGLALFPLQVMSLLEPQRTSIRTVDLPEGPVEVEVVEIDDHQIWGPSLEVLEHLVATLAT